LATQAVEKSNVYVISTILSPSVIMKQCTPEWRCFFGEGGRGSQLFLVNVGFMNSEGFLAPYRGQRYHLHEWRSSHQPATPEELFNMKHLSARNVIEGCFGVLKMHWAILRSPSFYPVRTVNQIVMACCVICAMLYFFEY